MRSDFEEQNSRSEDREPLDKGGVASDSFSPSNSVDGDAGGNLPSIAEGLGLQITEYMTLLCRQ